MSKPESKPTHARTAGLVLAVGLLGCAHASTTTAKKSEVNGEAAAAVARHFFESLSSGDTQGAFQALDGTMQTGLPPDKLTALWSTLLDRNGRFVGVDQTHVEPSSTGTGVIVLVHFAEGIQALTVYVSADGKISGLWNNAAGLVGTRFIKQLALGQYTEARASYDDTMRAAQSSEQLAEMWHTIEARHGTFRDIDRAWVVSDGEVWAAMVVSRFANGRGALKVVVNRQAQIAGVWILPDPEDK